MNYFNCGWSDDWLSIAILIIILLLLFFSFRDRCTPSPLHGTLFWA